MTENKVLNEEDLDKASGGANEIQILMKVKYLLLDHIIIIIMICFALIVIGMA